MKQTLLTICLIVFTLPSWGNNISDFKIDGLGIGDSLLEFMTQDEIIQSSMPFFAGGNDDEFLEYTNSKGNDSGNFPDHPIKKTKSM